MKKRTFLRLLSIATFGVFAPLPALTAPTKRFITHCPWNKVVGVRTMLGNVEYEIVARENACALTHQGQWITNYRRNKFWARPTGKLSPAILASFTPWFEGSTIYWQECHLSPDGTWYRA